METAWRDAWGHLRAALEPLLGGARSFVAVLAGLLTALLTLVLTLVALAALPLLAWRRSRARTASVLAGWTVRLGDAEVARLARWGGLAVHPDAGSARRAVYLASRLPVACVSALLLFVLGGLLGLFTVGAVWEVVSGTASEVRISMPGVSLSTSTFALGLGFTLVTFLALWVGVLAVTALDRLLARRLLGPSSEDLLHRRIDELARSRSGIVQAVDEERRRIERDLHDGVQQRVVALAMLLGRAQRGNDAERTGQLIRQAHGQTRVLLDELRDVAWRVYPTALDTLGLEAALAEVADRTPLPVSVDSDLAEPLPGPAATAVYFVAREAITNTVKHAHASGVVVTVRADHTGVELSVADDGRGGAEPDGSGLTGLARRLRAIDGTLSVHSPEGGPTVVRAFVPL
ncbi:sensor histidine kinase [Nocardiopsis lucentensis]|uniref:sensor histidine kinase n=1 Tax=Nocardiopsis lucentensis TaxID=53441 RepID=UPI0003482082|nr:histidine kinase [Nocardiopsis lucentensis]